MLHQGLAMLISKNDKKEFLDLLNQPGVTLISNLPFVIIFESKSHSSNFLKIFYDFFEVFSGVYAFPLNKSIKHNVKFFFVLLKLLL